MQAHLDRLARGYMVARVTCLWQVRFRLGAFAIEFRWERMHEFQFAQDKASTTSSPQTRTVNMCLNEVWSDFLLGGNTERERI